MQSGSENKNLVEQVVVTNPESGNNEPAYENPWVLISDNSGYKQIVNRKKEKKLRWKSKVFLQIGLQKNAAIPNYFKQDRDQIINCTEEVLNDLNEELQINENQSIDDIVQDKGNETIYAIDEHNTQKLTVDEITAMYKSSNTNDEKKEKIDEILANNQNFQKRTEFSKMKVKKRKLQKHVMYWRVEPCTLYNVFEYLVESKQKDMIFLREDTLSLFLQYADIDRYSHVYLVEKSRGCIVAPLLQIMKNSEDARIYITDFKSPHFMMNSYPAIQYLGLTNAVRGLVDYLDCGQAVDFENGEREITHLLLATEFDELEIQKSCEKKLVSGGKIVIYSKFLMQLEKIAEYLFDSKRYVNVNIVDTFMRKMQVLPKRTHPEMFGPSFGGYILYAYKIDL